MKDKLILVSNDDGYDARGIEALIDVVKGFGKVVAVAPFEGRSGMSHAISIKNPLRLIRLWERENVTLYGCTGTPVDSVKLALDQVLDRKPDLIVSGINHGSNASISIIYSGTMGAALEGCINGIPSIGFSVLDHSRHADFTLAKKHAKTIVEKVLQNGLPEGVGLNVNFPVVSESEFKGIRICKQTKGVWKEEFDKRTDPQKQDYFWLTGFFKNYEPEDEGTDEWALLHNYASVVPVKVDFTYHPMIDTLKSWNL